MNELETRGNYTPASIDDVKQQINLIQQLMRDVMKDKEHYGVIPGCGDKKVLLKPGAEKLLFTFRFIPDPEVKTTDLGGGHREYEVKTKIYTQSGIFIGAGVGCCSTMESKYRFRDAEPIITDKPVPKAYWDLKKANNMDKAIEIIGGKEFKAVKTENGWFIGKKTGEKIEHNNPADNYNTCLKIAKKRSVVDATITVTAASDIFTQDIDETIIEEEHKKPEPPKPKAEPKKDLPKNDGSGHSNYYLLKEFGDCKKSYGEETYYKLLANNNYKHANEIPVELRETILKSMMAEYDLIYSEQYNEEPEGTGATKSDTEKVLCKKCNKELTPEEISYCKFRKFDNLCRNCQPNPAKKGENK